MGLFRVDITTTTTGKVKNGRHAGWACRIIVFASHIRGPRCRFPFSLEYTVLRWWGRGGGGGIKSTEIDSAAAAVRSN